MDELQVIDLRDLTAEEVKVIKRAGRIQLLRVAVSRLNEGLPIRVFNTKKQSIWKRITALF